VRAYFDGRCCGCDREEPEVQMVVRGAGATHVEVGDWAAIELLFCADCVATLRDSFPEQLAAEAGARSGRPIDHAGRLRDETCSFCGVQRTEPKAVFRAYEVYWVEGDELMRVNQPLDLMFLRSRPHRREGAICICSICVRSASNRPS
jgi:hypothetical protein